MQSFRKIVRAIYRFIILWFVDTLSLWVTAAIYSGISIQSEEDITAFSIAAAAALLLGVINFLIRPIFLLLSVPFGFIAVFLVGFIINAVVLMLTSSLLSPSFHVSGWFSAFIGSLIFSAINTILTGFMTVDDEGSFYHAMIERLAKRDMYEDATDSGRGLVMLEIDGLSFHHMQKAIDEGWMPHVKEMIDDDGYVLSRVDCGLPSQTSACQSGIMFGDNHDIPAFRWFDKDENKLYVSGSDADIINARYAKGHGLMRDGSSVNNMMNGDARKSLLTLAGLRKANEEEKKQRARDVYLLMLDPYFFTRTMVFFLGDVIRELWQAWRQRANDVQPRLNRLHKGYPFIRAATTVFMRDLAAYLGILDIIRGTPALYITWPGYDEVAHHSGPWTSDAFKTLREYDRVIGRIREIINTKAPRPYELILLSDHGQSFGATFLQRYGYDLKELIERYMPEGAKVLHTSGGDDGTPSMLAMSAELENVQQQGMSGGVGKAVVGQTQKLFKQGVEVREESEDMLEPATVTVCGSGNIAQVYFNLYSRKINMNELNTAYPGMVDDLVAHEGVGFVVTYEDDGTPVVLGKGGRRNLHTGEVSGEDPLIPYGDVELRARQVRRVADFPHAGDLIVNSTLYPDGTVAAMEELIGNHGGLGGEQTDAFLLHTADLELPNTENSADVYAILNARRGLPGAPAIPQEEGVAGEVNSWSPGILVEGIARVRTWINLALHVMIFDTKAYKKIASDAYMTGPALLLSLLGTITMASMRANNLNLLMYPARYLLWIVLVLLLFGAGRLLGGKGSFTATFRTTGFAQGIFVLDILAFVPPIAPLVRILVSVLAFVATWLGVVEAHELRGWRAILVPVGMLVVIILGLFIIGTIVEGFVFTFDTLLIDFGLSPQIE